MTKLEILSKLSSISDLSGDNVRGALDYLITELETEINSNLVGDIILNERLDKDIIMNVQDLINALLKVTDKSLPVRVDLDAVSYDISGENLWIIDLEVSDTGESGYEEEGEVRLLVSE